jgi:hypothetical protein
MVVVTGVCDPFQPFTCISAAMRSEVKLLVFHFKWLPFLNGLKYKVEILNQQNCFLLFTN